MGLGPSSIESRATHTVPNHDARAFPGGYGFFERNPVPRTQHARESGQRRVRAEWGNCEKRLEGKGEKTDGGERGPSDERGGQKKRN